MYSLTFCVRVMLPERHQWKPAVHAAAVMLRTPLPRRRPVTGQPATPTSYIRRATLRTLRHPPVTGQQRAHTPPAPSDLPPPEGSEFGHVLPCSASTTRDIKRSSITLNKNSTRAFQRAFQGSTPPLTSSKWG